MNVTLISCFRNAENYLWRYLGQIDHLTDCIEERGDNLDLIWGEGDSTDSTLEQLCRAIQRFGIRAQIVDCTHGGQQWPSVVSPERFEQLGYVGRCMWAHIPQDANAVVYCESDLIWPVDTILRIVDQLQDYPAISPMVYLRRQGWPPEAWYDTWAARIGKRHFRHDIPYITEFDPDKPFRVDSMGSCMAIRGDLARQLVWDEDVFVGICRQIYQLGGSVWIDPKTSVFHL